MLRRRDFFRRQMQGETNGGDGGGDENLKAKEGNVLAKNKIFYGFSLFHFPID